MQPVVLVAESWAAILWLSTMVVMPIAIVVLMLIVGIC